jgi:hypothetical protein
MKVISAPATARRPFAEVGEHAIDDERRGDRQAAVVQQRAQLAFSTRVSSVSSDFSCASRFCSTTKMSGARRGTSRLLAEREAARAGSWWRRRARSMSRASRTAPSQLPIETIATSVLRVLLDHRLGHELLRGDELARSRSSTIWYSAESSV